MKLQIKLEIICIANNKEKLGKLWYSSMKMGWKPEYIHFKWKK